MTALVNYKQFKRTGNFQSCIFFYNKKIISKINDKSFLKYQLNIINDSIKLASSQNEKILEINLNSKLKIILVLLESKKDDLSYEKLGSELYDFLKEKKFKDYYFMEQNLKMSKSH